MPIRWKVVTKDRKSCTMVHVNIDMGRFKRSYLRGETVEAEKDSIGIMVFKRRKDAEKFMPQGNTFKYCIIVKVRGIGRGTVPKVIAITWIDQKAWLAIERLTKCIPFMTDEVPYGTICYKSVQVLT